MAYTERYANFDLATGLNDGTSEADAWQTPAAVIAGVAAGNRVNIKRQAAAYDLTATVTFSTAGTATAPIYYRAYTTTIGDGGIWDVAYNNSSIANLVFGGANNFVEGVNFFAGALTNSHSFTVSGANSCAIRCKGAITNELTLAGCLLCDFSVSGNSRLSIQGANSHNAHLAFSRFRRIGATTSGNLILADSFSRGISIIGCTIIGNQNAGEDAVFIDRQDSGRGVIIEGNRFYGFRDGIRIDEQPAANTRDIQIRRNVFSTMTSRGVNAAAAHAGFVYLQGNAYHSITVEATNYPEEAIIWPKITLVTTPYTDAASNDFSFNNVADGGGLLISQGFAINEPVDWSTLTFRPASPTPAEIATAVWARAGRTLT
jgi:hypothetical protein